MNIIRSTFRTLNVIPKVVLCVQSIIFYQDVLFNWCPSLGPSMQPLIDGQGELLFIDKLTPFLNRIAPEFRPYKRGEVVIASSPLRKHYNICKRILALPGDEVIIWDQQSQQEKSHIIPDGKCWLSGDNPAASYDSRHHGPVDQKLIIGRVLFKFWPIWRFMWIPSNKNLPLYLLDQIDAKKSNVRFHINIE